MVNSSKQFINEDEQFSLENFVTDDYQHGESYSGEPISITLDKSDSQLCLKFFFKNTDEDLAEEWVTEFFDNNGFERTRYELFNLSGEDTFITACFALNESGLEQDYIYSDEDKALIKPIEVNPQATIESMLLTTTEPIKSSTKAKPRASKKSKSQPNIPNTSVNNASPVTAAAIIASLGQSLTGMSSRVSTLDSNGNKVSAAKQINAFIMAALPNITDKELAILTDSTECKKRASLGFPLFMEVNPNLTYKDQATFLGKYRYSKRIVNILGKDYYVTNHLFQRNISKVEAMLTNLGLINQSNNSMPVNTSSNVTNQTNEISEDSNEIDLSINDANQDQLIQSDSETNETSNINELSKVEEINVSSNINTVNESSKLNNELDNMSEKDFYKLVDQKIESQNIVHVNLSDTFDENEVNNKLEETY